MFTLQSRGEVTQGSARGWDGPPPVPSPMYIWVQNPVLLLTCPGVLSKPRACLLTYKIGL